MACIRQPPCAAERSAPSGRGRRGVVLQARAAGMGVAMGTTRLRHCAPLAQPLCVHFFEVLRKARRPVVRMNDARAIERLCLAEQVAVLTDTQKTGGAAGPVWNWANRTC